MTNSISSIKRIETVPLLLIIFLSELPFIFNGYGLDGDAWSVIQSGYVLASGDGYQPSRFPGYPFPELVAGLIWFIKLPFFIPWIFNLITILLSLAAVFYYLFISAILINKNRLFVFLSALAFAFTPVFYINSTGMMDYNWALAFVLGSVYYLISDNLKLSALFLALAVACRITSVLFIIPTLFYLVYIDDSAPGTFLRRISGYILIVMITDLIIFSPLWLKYGLTFLSFDHPPNEYSIIKIAGRFTLRTWGLIGSLGILFALIRFLTAEKKIMQNLFTGNKLISYASLSIIIYLILFFALPLDAGYLLPAVPFIILLLYRLLSKKILIILSVMLIVSPFILNIEENKYSMAGPIFVNSEKRSSEENYLHYVISTAETFNKPSLVICEFYLHKLEVTLEMEKKSLPANVNLVYTLPEDSLKAIINRTHPQIYYLKNMREVIRNIYGYDLDLYDGRELIDISNNL